MNASFGIDHPLIAVNDINATRTRLMSMGFNMTPIGKHPWGTNNTLAMFHSCLIEIVGVYNDSLLDEKPAGDFHFGRHVYEHLQVREGIALSALHSTDIENDIKHAVHCGLKLSGSLTFGRDVTLPNGTADRTKTSLALLPDATFPRLSLFLCQQHKPELIYVSEWLKHPNTVYGYAGITIRANAEQQIILMNQFTTLYGNTADICQGFIIETANGTISVQSQKAIEECYFSLSDEVRNEPEPAIVAIDYKCQNLTTLAEFLKKSDCDFTMDDRSITLSEPQKTGHIIFRFIA